MRTDNQWAAQDSEQGADMSKKRDGNIQRNYRREINLQTKTIPSNKEYSRKQKHKGLKDEN